MPIYEFCCSKCGKEFEEITSGNEAVQCPHCGSRETEKLISACARRSKGGAGGYESMGAPASSGCGSCSGGNCASCGR